jgi:hypothetical protein
MSRPETEPGPPAWEARTLEKSHAEHLHISPRHGFLHGMCYMNILFRLLGLRRLELYNTSVPVQISFGAMEHFYQHPLRMVSL